MANGQVVRSNKKYHFSVAQIRFFFLSHLLPVVAALPPPQAAERERLPAPMPGLVRQAEEAGRPTLEWPGPLPPAQVWAVQTEEEVLVGARDRQAAVDPPALAQDLLWALSRAMILDEVKPIANFNFYSGPGLKGGQRNNKMKLPM